MDSGLRHIYLKRILVGEVKCILISGVPFEHLTEEMDFVLTPDGPGTSIHDIHRALSDDNTIVYMQGD